MPEKPVALVTGGGGGVGAATARVLASAGYRVAVLGRSPPPLEKVAAELGENGLAMVADVRDRERVTAAVDEIGRRWDAPRVLVNAAGVAASGPLLPPDDRLWADTMGVNATGAWVVSTAVLPGMLAAKEGAIVHVASTAALRGYRFVAAYVASKHALLGLTRALAEDLAGTGVRVNAICPGFLDTPMTDRNVAVVVQATRKGADEVRRRLAATNASGRLIPPGEVADLVLALVRDPTRSGDVVPLE